jgi:hypothetical protein
MSKYSAAQLLQLRLLARDEGGDAAYARRCLIDAGKTWTLDIKAANARTNMSRGNVWGATKPKTTINRTPSAAGKLALQRAATRKKNRG